MLHVLLFLGPIESRPPELLTPRTPVLIPVPSRPAPSEVPALVYLPPRAGASRQGRPEARSATPLARAAPRPPSVTQGPSGAAERAGEPPVAADSGARAPGPGGVRAIGPQYGNGVFWVRPVPVSPAQVARELERSHVEKLDSAVTVVMQAFLDSLETEAGRRQLPDWTTTLAGSKFGIDSRYIYVAGLKIPAAVLALLPLPEGGIDQQHALDHVIDVRADIEQAARRARNMEDFKRAIREIRERKQRERDFERAQREPPPSRDETETEP